MTQLLQFAPKTEAETRTAGGGGSRSGVGGALSNAAAHTPVPSHGGYGGGVGHALGGAAGAAEGLDAGGVGELAGGVEVDLFVGHVSGREGAAGFVVV